MADSDNGVTLKIDADAAGYIAQCVRMRQEHEKLHKHTEDWGAAIGHAARGMAEFLGPAGAVALAIEKGAEGLEQWREQLERASQTASVVVDKLRIAAHIAKEKREVVEGPILDAHIPVSIPDRVEAYSRFRSASPESARRVSAEGLMARIGQAAAVGYDPTIFAQVSGELEGAYGGRAFDVAASLYQNLGAEEAPVAADHIRRIARKAGPEAAKQLLSLFIASGRAGDVKGTVLNGLVDSYDPNMGSIVDQLARKRFTDRANSGLIGRILDEEKKVNINNIDGLLSRSADAATEDDKGWNAALNKKIDAEADATGYERFGAAAESKERREKLNKLAASKSLFGINFSWANNFWRLFGAPGVGNSETEDRLMREGLGLRRERLSQEELNEHLNGLSDDAPLMSASRSSGAISNGHDTTPVTTDRVLRHLAEIASHTAQAGRRRLNVDVHGEGAK